MVYEECAEQMKGIFMNPLFKVGFFDFFLKMQQEGIEAARRYWSGQAPSNPFFPNALDTYERIADFYIVLGFVPRLRYDEALAENKRLEEENKFLKDTIRELQVNYFAEGGDAAQRIWHKSIDKQLEVNREVAKNFFEVFRMLKVGAE